MQLRRLRKHRYGYGKQQLSSPTDLLTKHSMSWCVVLDRLPAQGRWYDGENSEADHPDGQERTLAASG